MFYSIAYDYRVLAFTVSGYSKLQILRRFYEELLAALEQGNTLAEFRSNMNGFLEREGYEGVTPYQAENIFRTNIQTAYNVGHYKQMTDPEVMKLRPYWQYDAVNDSPDAPLSPRHGWQGLPGGFPGLGYMVPAQRLQVPLYGAEPEPAAGGAAGPSRGDQGSLRQYAERRALCKHHAGPPVCQQPGKDPVEAGPEGVSRAPGEGIPGAGKKADLGKRRKRPLTPLRRRGRVISRGPRKTASNAVRTALTAVLGLCPGKETRKKWRSSP